MSRSPYLQSLVSFMRARSYSKRLNSTFCHWVKHFISFCGKQPPEHLGPEDRERLLYCLAVERVVTANTSSGAQCNGFSNGGSCREIGKVHAGRRLGA